MGASGDWDGSLCLWDVSKEKNDSIAEGIKKKRKTDATSGVSSKTTTTTISPKISLKAHVSNMSGIQWSYCEKQFLITSSWDHSLKVWDIEKQDCLTTLLGTNVITSLGRSTTSDVVATTHPDNSVRLWDARISSKNEAHVMKSSFKRSHKAWVSAVQWSPTEPHLLATNSYDGCIKLWDIRSTLPLYTVRAHEKDEKGLCLAFHPSGKALFCAGSDCVVKKFDI